MKYSITFFLIIVLGQFSFGQQHKIDSLKVVLTERHSDTAKIVVLNELAMKTGMSEPEACNKYALQALQIAEANNYFLHIIDTYTVLASLNDELGYYNISLEYLYKILDLFVKKGDNEQIAVTSFKIATVHFRKGEDDLCLEYCSKIVDYESELMDSLLIAQIYTMMGKINLNKGDYKKAETYWKKASEIYLEKNNTYGINYVRNSFASLYEKFGEYEKAIVEYEKVLVYCRSVNNTNCICPVLNHIGDVYRKQKLFEKARGYYLESFNIARRQGMKDSEMDSYLLFFELDSLEGNYKDALYNHINYIKILDAISSQEKENRISELHIKYQSRQTAKDIKILQETEKRNNEMIIAISIIMILLLIALIFHWRMLRIKHKSNAQLEKSEKRLRLSQQAGKIGAWEWDLKNNKIYWSDITYQIFGVQKTSNPIDNDQYLEYVHPDDRHRLINIFNEFIKDEDETLNVEYRIVKNNGIHWINETSELIFNKKGEAIKMIGVIQDITDYKESQLALQESETRLKTLLNSVPDIICFKDGEGRWLIANDADLKLFQIEDVDYIGKKDSELAKYSPNYYDAFMGCEDSDELAWKEKGISRVVENIPNINGDDFIFDIIKVPIFNKDNTRDALVVFGRDITDIKKAEQVLFEKNTALTNTLNQLKETKMQLVQSEKMASIGVLTAGIAHEINNPVNFIQGGVNSLVRDFKDIEVVLNETANIGLGTGNVTEKLQHLKKLTVEYNIYEAMESIPEILKDIKLGADRTTAIIKSLGSFARNDDDLQMLDIHESIENSLILLRSKYKHNIELIKQFDSDIPQLKCSVNKINQIFLNLLSNAIDAISEKGKIYITTKLLADKISISIKDTGDGISKELQSKVFDPFYTSKVEGKGIGMGLYIVYGFIQEHNGSIEVISEGGKGSEFIVTLPIA